VGWPGSAFHIETFFQKFFYHFMAIEQLQPPSIARNVVMVNPIVDLKYQIEESLLRNFENLSITK